MERTPSRRPGLCFLIHTKRQGDCDPKTIGIKVDLHIRTGLHGKHPFKQTRPEPLAGRELNGRPIVLIPHPAQLTGIFIFHRPSHFNPTPNSPKAPCLAALVVSSWSAMPIGTASSDGSSTGGPASVIRCSEPSS